MAFDPSAAAQPGSGVFGLPHSEEEAGVVLVPVPFEATTSYGGGTNRGPEAILSASRQVDLFDVETGRPYEAGIHMLDVPEHVASQAQFGDGGVHPGVPRRSGVAAEFGRRVGVEVAVAASRRAERHV